MVLGAVVESGRPGALDGFVRDVAEVNRRRLRVIGPIMVAVHVVHVWVFWVAEAERHTLTAAMLRARHDLVLVHCVMVPIAGLLTVLVFRSRYDAIARLMGPVVATLYLVHGAVCTACDLIAVDSVTVYMTYCLGMAIIVCISPRAAIIAYCIGLTALIAAFLLIVPSAFTGLATIPNCATITIVGVALASLLHAARRRDFRQRQTIEQQHDQLRALNTGLEQRVQDQVGEILARATEVDQLNAQLQVQVRARSSELSLALARLAKQRRQSDALLHGTVLGGRFIVGPVIGEGAMGAVHAGVDQTTGARVAIKVVQATSTRTLDALRRFVREAGAAATVTHPAVVRMLDVDISDDGLLFQVQELIEGDPLARMARRAWSPGDAARLGAVLCDALAAAHAVGVVHRDVKPENVMLTTGAPGLKLVDFGIAKLHAAAHGDRDDGVTRTGMIIGTPAYMAPEQAFGATDVSDRADVYAVGVMLFRLLSERQPFEAGSLRDNMMGRLLRAAPSVREFQPSVPHPLARWVDRCLARQPDDRPTAAELAIRLAAWADSAGAPRLERIVKERRVVIATLPSTLPAMRGLDAATSG
jgi:serine/threonine-protein kinase